MPGASGTGRGTCRRVPGTSFEAASPRSASARSRNASGDGADRHDPALFAIPAAEVRHGSASTGPTGLAQGGLHRRSRSRTVRPNAPDTLRTISPFPEPGTRRSGSAPRVPQTPSIPVPASRSGHITANRSPQEPRSCRTPMLRREEDHGRGQNTGDEVEREADGGLIRPIDGRRETGDRIVHRFRTI